MSASPDDKPASSQASASELATAEHVATLTQAVQLLAETVAKQGTYGRRNRHMIWGLVATFTFDVLLTAVVWWFAVQAQNANDSAEQARQNQISICLSGNTARAQNKELWDY